MRVQVNAPNVATRRVCQGGLAASLNRGWTTGLPGASGPIVCLVVLGVRPISAVVPQLSAQVVPLWSRPRVMRRRRLIAAARWCSQWSFLVTPR